MTQILLGMAAFHLIIPLYPDPINISYFVFVTQEDDKIFVSFLDRSGRYLQCQAGL